MFPATSQWPGINVLKMSHVRPLEGRPCSTKKPANLIEQDGESFNVSGCAAVASACTVRPLRDWNLLRL
jgi:hypothetical protein